MAYKTKPEKRAYRTGLLNGLRRLKKKRPKNKANKENTNVKVYKKKENLSRRVSQHKYVKRRIGGGARNKTPVYDYSTFFDFDERGRIKGSYTPDGFFEPD